VRNLTPLFDIEIQEEEMQKLNQTYAIGPVFLEITGTHYTAIAPASSYFDAIWR
jgi:hypothetical protein